ncbi:MAG: hypothetical protein Q8S33_20630 [Myxococcales bacterium]|nr:hypothetical protein [Myxococcales bacterium]MDP3502752.1 hypothetical protein [Myxococcales bacterium]
MIRPIRVFYEDSQQHTENNFGPHVLALQCVCDLIPARNVWSLRNEVRALCRNGVTKLIADARQLDDEERKVLAPDEDRIREHLALKSEASEEAVVTELAAQTRSRASHIVLIVRNMDDVARAAADVLGSPLPASKPTMRERDAVCHALVDSERGLRSDFLRRSPSFAKLVACLHRLLQTVTARS